MRRWIIVLLLLAISCTQNNEVIDQIYVDYFPAEVGMKWIYRSRDSLVVVREVLEDSEVSTSLNLVQIEMLGELEYYKKSPDHLAMVYEYSRFLGGDEVIFDKNDLLLFYQPVLQDEFFSDTLSRIVVLGDTFRYTRIFWSQITPGSGERRNLSFKITTTLRRSGGEEQQSVFAFYKLAPDTGPVYIKKIYSGDTVELFLEQFLK